MLISEEEKIVYNKKFVLIYDDSSINIYENNSLSSPKLVFGTEFISNIQFNPIIDNMILVSFSNGSCKIYLILENKLEEKILFEGINNQKILKSNFNELNTNIILAIY